MASNAHTQDACSILTLILFHSNNRDHVDDVGKFITSSFCFRKEHARATIHASQHDDNDLGTGVKDHNKTPNIGGKFKVSSRYKDRPISGSKRISFDGNGFMDTHRLGKA